jgi:hypothetical protein
MPKLPFYNDQGKLPVPVRRNCKEVQVMPSRKLSPQDLQKIHDLAHQWGKIVVRHAFGDEGPGLDVDLDTMEAVAVAAARGLTAGALEQATAQQAQRLGDAQPCPACGQLCPVGHEERSIQVRGGGDFCHRDPVCHCPACRRDFFPPAALPPPR